MCDKCGNPLCPGITKAEEEFAEYYTKYVTEAKSREDLEGRLLTVTSLFSMTIGSLPLQVQVQFIGLFLENVSKTSADKRGASSVRIMTDKGIVGIHEAIADKGEENGSGGETVH